MYKKIFVAGVAFFLLAACNDNATEENENTANETATSTEVNNTNVSTANTSVDIANPTVTLKEAVDIFLQSYPYAKIESIELGTEFGQLNYEIDGFDSAKEYEVKIDAATKEMKVVEAEADTSGDEALDLSNIIEPKEAMEQASAAEEAKGFSPTSWSLEVENGKQVYTIEFRKNATEIDVKVDAATGEVLEKEIND